MQCRFAGLRRVRKSEFVLALGGLAVPLGAFTLSKTGIIGEACFFYFMGAYPAGYLGVASVLEKGVAGLVFAVAAGLWGLVFRAGMEAFARSHTPGEVIEMVALQSAVVIAVLIVRARYRRVPALRRRAFWPIVGFAVAFSINLPMVPLTLGEPLVSPVLSSADGPFDFCMTSAGRPGEVLAYGGGKKVALLDLAGAETAYGLVACERIIGFGGPSELPPLIAGDNLLESGERDLLLQQMGSDEILARFAVPRESVPGELTNGISDDGTWLALQKGRFVNVEDHTVITVPNAARESVRFVQWVRGRTIAALYDSETRELLLVEPEQGVVRRHMIAENVLGNGLAVSPSVERVAVFAGDGDTLVIQPLSSGSARTIRLTRRAAPREVGICPAWIDEHRVAYVGRKHSVMLADTQTGRIDFLSPPGQIVQSLAYSVGLGGPVWSTEFNKRFWLYGLTLPSV
jgi:hypothetical protein